MLIEAFIRDANIPGASVAYWYENPSKTTELATKTIVVLNSILADVILIWRLYVIWGRNRYICIVPSIIVLAYSIVYFVGVWKLSNLTGNAFSSPTQWGVAGLGMSAITHASVTLTIAGRIWWRTRACEVGYPLMARSRYAAWIVLESGAVYSTAAMFVVIFGSLKTWVGGLLSDIIVQLAELIPTIIVVRAGIGLTSENSTPCPRLARTSLEFSVDHDRQVPPSPISPGAFVLNLDNLNTPHVDAKLSV